MPIANASNSPAFERAVGAAAAASVPVARPKVALVIGAGSLKCAAAFGVVKVLQSHAIPIDLVVGCSGGAFCASWVAAGGGDASEAAERFARGWQGAFKRVDYRAILSAVFPRLLRFSNRASIVDDRAINAAIQGYVGESTFEGLATPLYLVATDFITGEPVVLQDGRLADAIRATIALPLILPPWPMGGRHLVDGAVCNPLPVDIAVKAGADIIIAIGFEDPLSSKFESGAGLVRQLITLLVNHLYRAQFAFYNLVHHAETLIIVPEIDRRVGLDDVHLVPYLVERGAAAAELEIPYLLRLLAPGSLKTQAVTTEERLL
jgi:NTE family protein